MNSEITSNSLINQFVRYILNLYLFSRNKNEICHLKINNIYHKKIDKFYH